MQSPEKHYLFVHGSREQPPANELYELWQQWISKSADINRKDIAYTPAYYADLTSHEVPGMPSSNFQIEVVPKLEFEIMAKSNTHDSTTIIKPTAAILSAIVFWFQSLGADLYCGQSRAWLNVPSVRESINARVEKALGLASERAAQQKRQLVVIAHSLGAPAAYEAVVRRAEIAVDHFITLGNPMGLSACRANMQFDKNHYQTAVPKNIARWTNIWSVEDLVSGETNLRPRILKNGKPFIVDYKVNNRPINIGKLSNTQNLTWSNDIKCYIDQPAFAQALHTD